MITILNSREVVIEWSIKKSPGADAEHFEGSEVRAFAIGGGDKVALDIDSISGGVIRARMPQIEVSPGVMGIPVGVYDLKLLWAKNGGGRGRRNTATHGVGPDSSVWRFHGYGGTTAPKRGMALDNWKADSRCLMCAYVDGAFAATDVQEEVTPSEQEEQTIRVKSYAASYGYDGLSAYETAVMFGITTALSEKEYTQIRASYVDTNQIADGAITTAKIADEAVTTVKIADENVTTAKIADGNVTTAKIADENVTTVKIADEAVTTAKIANENVTTVKIADENVTTAKIADGAVTTAKIAEENVTTVKIADEAVTTAKIASGAVTTVKIADENVTTAKIADENVTTAKIADGNVTTVKIADEAVTTAKIADGNVTTAKIADGNVRTEKIAAGAVTTEKIAAENIVTSHLASGAVTTEKIEDYNAEDSTPTGVTTEKIADAAVTTAKIADGGVTTSKIADGAVTTVKIGDGEVHTEDIADANVTTAKIADENVTTAKISDGAVTTVKIADGNVTTAKIADENVTTAKIAAGAVTRDKIADGAITELTGMYDTFEQQIAALAGLTEALTLTFSPGTIYKGVDQTVTLTGRLLKGTPTAMWLYKQGTAEPIKSGTTSPITETVTLNTTNNSEAYRVEGETDGMTFSATGSVVARYPIYYGFGTTASDVAIVANRVAATTSAARTYNKTVAGSGQQNFFILVPSDIAGLSTFVMNGAPFAMNPMTTETINGVEYKVYKSQVAYNPGTAVSVEAK